MLHCSRGLTIPAETVALLNTSQGLEKLGRVSLVMPEHQLPLVDDHSALKPVKLLTCKGEKERGVSLEIFDANSYFLPSKLLPFPELAVATHLWQGKFLCSSP